MRQALPRLLADAGIELLRMEADGASTWKSLVALRPELLVADMELPQIDGASLVQRAVCTCQLPLRPAVILLRWPEFVPANRAELEMAGTLLLEKPLQVETFCRAVEQLSAAPPAFLTDEVARVEALLDKLGVPEHPGRECLKFAVLICAGDESARHALGKKVYPWVGELCKLSPAQAERAMRHAIDRAWQSDKFENQYRIFADTVDAARGQPTLREMISRLADILRSEG